MFDIGFQELIIIFVVALLVFGPKKLPEVGRTFGKWIIDIRKGIQNAKVQMEAEFQEPSIKPIDDIVKPTATETEDKEETAARGKSQG